MNVNPSPSLRKEKQEVADRGTLSVAPGSRHGLGRLS